MVEAFAEHADLDNHANFIVVQPPKNALVLYVALVAMDIVHLQATGFVCSDDLLAMRFVQS